ncbi:hypothetical protein U1872_03615 [Sphingomonas sp. RB3P16]|uniref:hypothetical protein n=1 Tax=Parasphingomonas frigoris TaxID=3096163 RepID=UPI002FC69D80
MTSVSSSSRPPAANPSRSPTQARPEANAHDVRAMADAFARARRQDTAGGQTGKQGKLPAGVAAEVAANAPRTAALAGDPLRDALQFDRELAQQHGDGLALLGQSGAPVAVPLPSPPPPQVDPSAFAQLMTQLWAREHGKGSKEVRVQFGPATWPTTGARLVQNPAGTLDVELYVGAQRAPSDGALDALRQGFADRGLEVGALSVAPDQG